MDQVSQQSVSSSLSGDEAGVFARCPRITIHFSVVPLKTVEWRVRADSELQVKGACVWLTRLRSDYDHWLLPGDTIRLKRGERIWLSVDGEMSADVAVTHHYAGFSSRMSRWFGRLASLR